MRNVWRRGFSVAAGLAVVVVLIGAAGRALADRDEHRGDGHGDGHGDGRGLDWRALQGFAIAPVHLDLHGKDPRQVGLGSYLVNAIGGCNDCHTWPNYRPGGDPYQGQKIMINAAHYLAGGRPFGPGLASANITPDAHGRPAGLTWHEFERAIRTGHDPDGAGLLQVMPWPVYRNMIDADLEAIYAFLTAIPHAEPDPNPPAGP